jgi:platelet-activating factor acetylhydrolase
VVAAVEHRDGSTPGSVVMDKATGTRRNVLLTPRQSLDPAPDVPELKRAQLAQRQAEVEETARVLRAINAGDDVFGANARGEGADLVAWAGHLDTDRIVIVGHSYGATLALQALRPEAGPGKEVKMTPKPGPPPFVAGIVLDPGKNSGRLNGDVDVPLLVVHSQLWSAKPSDLLGQPHFDAVR